jgi:hypothetical protein
MYPKGLARRRLPLLLLLGTLTALALAACDTGHPPALGKAVQVPLLASSNAVTLGQATLTPNYGAHLAVYMHGSLLPYDAPTTPAQLRQGGCYGKVVAPLSANAPTGGSRVTVHPDAKTGADVATAVNANWYVVVLKSAAPDALVGYCGHPLSDRRQYFDLYLPDRVDNGIGYGSVLIEGIVITQVRVSLATPATQHPAQWSIRSGGCQGSALASGTIAPGAATGSGTAFAPFDAKSWWLTVNLDGASSPAACVKAG